VAAVSARRSPSRGCSDSSRLREWLTSDSPSTISMTIEGLPSSSPVGSNHNGAGMGIFPDEWSAESTSHSAARSVSRIDWPGGGSDRTM
jgi:hypothetical protein